MIQDEMTNTDETIKAMQALKLIGTFCEKCRNVTCICDSVKVMAKCDECGRDIMDNEVAMYKNGITCYECLKKEWNDATKP